MMSLTGPQTLDVHSAGVENSSAIAVAEHLVEHTHACLRRNAVCE